MFLRMVESQEDATGNLVDSLAEQAALERLLETSKPPLPAGAERLHYLLATPFRYPPLPYGSRFGGRHEPGLCYGALSRSSLIAEASYYRFLFLAGMSSPPAKALITRHTAFSARFRTRHGLRLERPPFDEYRSILCSPADYRETQALGQSLREAGVEAFTYVSARDPSASLNAALFTPDAFSSAAPRGQSAWTCAVTAAEVTWREQGAHDVITLPVATFLVDGALPSAAA